MLLDSPIANNPVAQEVGLDALDPGPANDSETQPKPKLRVRRLRRMQSQNFIERAFYNVEEMFGLHSASA